MKDTHFEIENSTENQPHSEAYLAGAKGIEDAAKRREQQGYGMMVAASAMAGGYTEGGKQPRIVAIARNFCILFAFAAPNLLIIKYLL